MGGGEADQGNSEKIWRLAVQAEWSIARGLAFTGISPIPGDYRYTAVSKRFSVWKQNTNFRGGGSDPIPKITGYC
jgi:hypothetical protein